MRLMNKSVLIITFILLMCSCTRFSKNKNTDLQTVELNLTENSISESPVVNPKDNLGLYGPDIEDEIYKQARPRNKTIAVIIGPAIYNSIESLRLLQCMEKLGQKVNLVLGHGFSLILAAMYAQGDSIETIRWKVFKEMRKIRGLKPYSKKWSKSWLKFVDKNISHGKIKESQRSLWFFKPLSRVSYTAKGSLQGYFKKNLLVDRRDFSLKYNFLEESKLAFLPVEKIFYVNAISEKFTLKYNDDYLVGLFSKAYSHSKKIKSKNITVININISKKLDEENMYDSSYVDETFCKNIERTLGNYEKNTL